MSTCMSHYRRHIYGTTTIHNPQPTTPESRIVGVPVVGSSAQQPVAVIVIYSHRTLGTTMSSAIVQLIRNFLCCVKDLSYGSHHHYWSWLYDPTITHTLLQDWLQILPPLIAPLNRTTPLEAMISIAQFYVVVTGVPEAIHRFWFSYRQMHRSLRLIESRTTTKMAKVSSHAERLIHVSLIQEASYCIRSMFVSFNCFFICVAFIWLSANSWHITQTDWLGGLPALIHALTIMNICLMPLLYYMYVDAMEHFRTAFRIRTLYQQLLLGTVSQADIGLSSLKALSKDHEFVPFWSVNYTGTFDSSNGSVDESTQLLNNEITKVNKLLDSVIGTTVTKKKTDQDQDATNGTDESVQLRKKLQQDIAIQIRPLILKSQLYGIREMIYFILNFIAWYGYGMCIVVYYFPIVLQQPDYVRILLFYYHNDDADWYGNFAGDVMWTIEPMIVLFSPFWIQRWTTVTPRTVKPPVSVDDKTKTE